MLNIRTNVEIDQTKTKLLPYCCRAKSWHGNMRRQPAKRNWNSEANKQTHHGWPWLALSFLFLPLLLAIPFIFFHRSTRAHASGRLPPSPNPLIMWSNIHLAKLAQRSYCGGSFFRLTQYNADTHNTHAHSPLWIHIRKPYPYEHLRRTEHRQIWRFSKSPLAPRRRRECRLPLNV
jgi:hypothetical protein